MHNPIIYYLKVSGGLIIALLIVCFSLWLPQNWIDTSISVVWSLLCEDSRASRWSAGG